MGGRDGSSSAWNCKEEREDEGKEMGGANQVSGNHLPLRGDLRGHKGGLLAVCTAGTTRAG